MTLKLQVQL